MIKKYSHTLTIILLIAVAQPSFASSLKLNSKLVTKVSGKLCGYIKKSKKWVPIKKVGSNLYNLIGSPSSAHKKACSSIVSSALKSLKDIPDASSISTSSKSKTSKIVSSLDKLLAVSGTPPALNEISSIGISNLFWRSGVIDGFRTAAPTADQCSEFWIGQQDGESGGMLACTMAEDVGYAFEPILRGDTSLCYMRNIPSSKSGIEVVSGDLPEGGMTKLFDTSVTETKIIKINTSGSGDGEQQIFIRIPSKNANDSEGFQYRASLWFCGRAQESDTSDSVMNTQNISVTLSGQMRNISVGNDRYGRFSADIQGTLASSAGEIGFDPAQQRTATIRYHSISGQNKFNSQMIFGAGGKVIQKFYNFYRNELSKRYTISTVDGDLQTLKFYEGAFKETHTLLGHPAETHSGATEYRDEGYRSAPNSDLINQADNISFDNDSFYSELKDSNEIDSTLSCDTTPTLELNMNMSDPSIQEVVESCETKHEQVNNFCRENDVLREITSNFPTLCSGAN